MIALSDRTIVERRAGGRCEYCLMHQSLQGAVFHVEHVAPQAKGGQTTLENLAFACPNCNLLKNDRTDAVDTDTGSRVGIFHPRQMSWADHFRWNGFVVEGVTAIGRATVALLDLNNIRRLRIRRAEFAFSLFPPVPAGD